MMMIVARLQEKRRSVGIEILFFAVLLCLLNGLSPHNNHAPEKLLLLF